MVIEDSVENVVKSGNINRVIELVENGVDINNTLCYASENGNIDLIKILIGLGADINKDSNRPLRWALNNGKIEAAKLLIEYGADINSGNGWVLDQASSNGQYESVKFLIESGAIVNNFSDCSCSSLECASSEGHLDIVKLLIEHKPSQKAIDSALWLAAKWKNYSIIRYLIEMGGKISYHTLEMLLGIDRPIESRDDLFCILNTFIVDNK